LITIFGSVLLFLLTIKELYVTKSNDGFRENNIPAAKYADPSTSTTVVRFEHSKMFHLF